MSLEQIFDNLIDPFFDEGDIIDDEIIEKFFNGMSPPLQESRNLAIKYAQHKKTYYLSDEITTSTEGLEAASYDYSLWARAISEARTGNWLNLADQINEEGEIYLLDSETFTDDEELGWALINLAESLLL